MIDGRGNAFRHRRIIVIKETGVPIPFANIKPHLILKLSVCDKTTNKVDYLHPTNRVKTHL